MLHIWDYVSFISLHMKIVYKYKVIYRKELAIGDNNPKFDYNISKLQESRMQNSKLLKQTWLQVENCYFFLSLLHLKAAQIKTEWRHK